MSILDLDNDEIDLSVWTAGREDEFKGMSDEAIISQLKEEAARDEADQDVYRQNVEEDD